MLTGIGPSLVLMAVCLVLSAFFSASETALTSLDPVKTQKLIDGGGFWSRSLSLWRDKPMMVLTCILIGNNIVNIAASALATELSKGLLANSGHEESALPLTIGVMTLIVLTFGEITPKTLAKAKHQELAGRFMWALRLPYLVFWPLTWLFTRLTKLLMSLMGDNFNETKPNVTEEDIEYLVELGSREGNLGDVRERILQSAFEFETTKVREIMIPRIEMLALERKAPLNEVLDALIASGHSRLPVYDEKIDNIVGLFYSKDLLKHLKREGDESQDGVFTLNDFIRPAYFVPESKKIDDLLSEFQKGRIHMAIVVGEFGGTSGLITLEDIIEEFFGEIRDEYDAEEDYFQVLAEGHVMAAGRCPLDELEDLLDITFPAHPEYDSLGGFILSQTGELPEPGTEVAFDGMVFKVTRASARRILQVEIIRVVQEGGSTPVDKSPRLLAG